MNGTELAQWVQTLIDRGEPESVSLDFKRQLPDAAGRKSFLHDVSAMANTWGGRIVYGVEEDRSRAVALSPLQGDPDAEVNRLADMASSGIEPRLAGLRITTADVPGGYVLIVEVPQQFDGPFRSQLEGRTWFKCRIGQVNRDMTYGQLKNSFGERSRMLDNLRAWRVARIKQHREFIPRQRIADSAWAVLHVLPLASFSEQFSFDLKKLSERGYTFRQNMPGSRRFNSDGLQFIAHSAVDQVREYAQFFRRGMIEIAWTCRLTPAESQQVTVASTTNALNVHSGLKRAGEILVREGLTSSVAVAFSLLNVANHKLYYSDVDYPGYMSEEQYDDTVIYPENFIERTADLSEIPGAIAKPLLDAMWQTFNLPECTDLDEAGNWNNRHQPAYV